MTFDQEYQSEAEGLFDSRHQLELKNGDYWEPLCSQKLIDDAFTDRSRACQLASASGAKLTNGMSVRFKL